MRARSTTLVGVSAVVGQVRPAGSVMLEDGQVLVVLLCAGYESYLRVRKLRTCVANCSGASTFTR